MIGALAAPPPSPSPPLEKGVSGNLVPYCFLFSVEVLAREVGLGWFVVNAWFFYCLGVVVLYSSLVLISSMFCFFG